MPQEQYVIKTGLHVNHPLYKSAIEEVVQLRSRIESFSNLVYTHACLTIFRDGHYELLEHFVSQTVVTACARAICVRGSGVPCPVTISSRIQHSQSIQSCLRTSQAQVVQQMCTDGVDFPNDDKLQDEKKARKQKETKPKNNQSPKL